MKIDRSQTGVAAMRHTLLLSLVVCLSFPSLLASGAPPHQETLSQPRQTSGQFSRERATAQEADTLEGIQRIRHIVRDYYRPIRSFMSSSSQERLTGEVGVGSDRDPACDGSEILCHGGDPDRGSCRAGASCHPTPEFLMEILLETATEYPTSGFIMGQAVYALTKYRQPTLAMVLVTQCEAQRWWCKTLEGYVLHSMGRFPEAEASFREALEETPVPQMCAYGDAVGLLGQWDQQWSGVENTPESRDETRGWPCLDRLEVSDTLFWLADPLYSVEGNERWVEHRARALGLQFYEEIREIRRGIPMPEESVEYEWAARVRRGTWDSYLNPPGRRLALYTGQPRARYHFVPNVEPGDLSQPTWRLEADLWDEGFTPTYGPFFNVPVQLARFRTGDSLQVAVAGALVDSPLEGASGISAHFFLTDGPGSFPLHLSGASFRTTSIFLGQVPSTDYVASLEIQSSQGIGWHRESVAPLRPSGPELSDLLLYRTGVLEPDSLLAAIPLMLGSTHIERGAGVGVYWEAYGVGQNTELELELSLTKESGGIMGRLGRILPGGSRDGYGPVRWTTIGVEGTNPGLLALDLSSLEPGEYDLVLNVRWEGQPVMERTRRVTVG